MNDDEFDLHADAVLEVLGDGRPRTPQAIAHQLLLRGHDLGSEPLDVIDDILMADGLGPLLAIGEEEEWVYLPPLFQGRTFTHRVTALEVEYDCLSLDIDLQGPALLQEDDRYKSLTDGTPLIEVLSTLDADLLAQRGIPIEAVGASAWLLPAGTYAALGIGAGGLAGITVRQDGLELGTAEMTATDPALPPPPEEPIEIVEVVCVLCADDPDAFRSPTRPLRDVLADAGYGVHGDYVVEAGFDFDAWHRAGRLRQIANLYRIDAGEAWAVLALGTIHQQLQAIVEEMGDAAPEAVNALLEDGAPVNPWAPTERGKVTLVDALLPLADPTVTEAAAVEILGAGRDNALALAILADSLEPGVPRPVRPSLRWLRGRALERLGRVVEAERAYERVLSLDSGYPLALYSLAQIASERGNAERGLALLRRAAAPADDGLLELLQAFRPVERTDIGRNQQCWCGSGRKYKACHLHNEHRPLEDRASWLYQKAAAYLQDGPWRLHALALAEIRAADQSSPNALWEALNDGLVVDALLFEGGAFEEYLGERGVLLPDDERLLAEQWLLSERSVWEIESVTVGAGFRARDLRSGDRADIRERLGSRGLKPGMLVCTRIVPAGESMQCFGGIEIVSMQERDWLLDLFDEDYEATELISVLSAKYAPPTLQNTEGEPLLQCEAVVRPSDPAQFVVGLDERYERDDVDEGWLEHVTTHGMRRIRSLIRREGDDFAVQANSAARYERVLSVLRDIDPDLLIVSENRTTGAALLAKARAAGMPRGEALDPNDPEVAAALREVVLQYEATWLDELVPALGNVTPRQAADDPTRRDDLIRLLGTLPDTDIPGQMSPSRLRAALGL